MRAIKLAPLVSLPLLAAAIAEDTFCVAPGGIPDDEQRILLQAQTWQGRAARKHSDTTALKRKVAVKSEQKKRQWQSSTSLTSSNFSDWPSLWEESPPDPDLSLPGHCGFNKECSVDFLLADVNHTALLSQDQVERDRNLLAMSRLHNEQLLACTIAAEQGISILESGGWCYADAGSRVINAALGHVDIDYRLPANHALHDEIIVSTLAEHVLLREDGSCCYSLTDLGAGVGQFGHALRAWRPQLAYYGYDGAGNVEEFTGNYVQFADMSKPLSLKRTDWVISAEVGEHIPHEYEAQVIANIHAHNCRGVILTWAVPGQVGHGHINCHSNAYIKNIFEQLGYKWNAELSDAIRANRGWDGSWWFMQSAMVFDRISVPASCPPV